MSGPLPWQYTEAQKDAQLPYLPSVLQAAPGRLDALEGSVDGALSRLDAVEGQVGALDGRLDVVESLGSTLDGRVDALEASQVTALDDLSDVVLTSPVSGDNLYHDGTGWKNRTAAAADWLRKVGDAMLGPLQLAASALGAAGTAALKIPSGPLLVTPEAGAIERLVDKLYFTISSGLRKLLVLADASLTSGRIPFTTTDGRLADTANLTRDVVTGDITLGDGANLVISGGNASGESCIVFGGAPSTIWDSNVCRVSNTNMTMGFVCGTVPGFGGANGPFFGLRGNTFTAQPNQRGTLFFGAGIPSAPNATLEGRIRFLTNDTDRFVIRYDGTALVYGILTLPKTSGYGIMVDPAAPTFGWRDLTCAIDPKATGTGSPARTLYRGTIYAYAFVAGDIADFDGFHIPHDYVPGSNLYVHVHWSHNGTAISGSAVFEVTMSYAKGHNQANFPAEVTQTITVATPNIATVPQYRHRVDEVQASTPGGSATLHNTTNLEVDGLMIGYLKLVTLPTITGGSLFVHTVDIHYQSSNMATKNKAPGFYA